MNVTLCSKMDFEDIKRSWNGNIIQDYSGRPPLVFIQGEQVGDFNYREMMWWWKEIGVIHFEEERRGHKAQNTDNRYKVKKQKWILSKASKKKPSYQYRDFIPVKMIWSSEFYNCERINLSCSKFVVICYSGNRKIIPASHSEKWR